MLLWFNYKKYKNSSIFLDYVLKCCATKYDRRVYLLLSFNIFFSHTIIIKTVYILLYKLSVV